MSETIISLTLQAWLEMTIQVKEETEPSQVRANREAQHKHLTWRVRNKKEQHEESLRSLCYITLVNMVNTIVYPLDC